MTGNFDEGSLGMRVTQPSSPILCAEVQTLVAVEVGLITGAVRVCDCLSLHTSEGAGDAGPWLGAHVGHVSVWHIHGGVAPQPCPPTPNPGEGSRQFPSGATLVRTMPEKGLYQGLTF